MPEKRDRPGATPALPDNLRAQFRGSFSRDFGEAYGLIVACNCPAHILFPHKLYGIVQQVYQE